MPSGCPKNVQQEWAACNTDQEVALVIQQYPGPRPHLTEPLTPARRQFLYNEPQSPTYSLYEWLDTSDPYSLKHGEQPGLQHCKEPTYWPLLHAYLHLLPQNDEYSGLNYHWVEHSSRFPTDGWTRAKDVSHKTVQQYWSDLWSAFIHLLYGHRLIFRRRLRTRSIVRFLAILHLLADYHQAWEQVGHVIRSTMRELPNIGKLVAQDPEFMVCISYRLQCQVIYYDALKHIAGRALYSSMIFSESDFYYERSSAPDDVQMLPLPESIVNAVAETCWRMRNSLLNRHQTFVHHLAHAHSDHRDTLQAEYRVAATAFLAFVNGWQEIVPVTKASARPHASRLSPSCEPVDEDAYDAYRTDMKRFQLPNLYLTLWQLSCSGTDQQLSFDLSLESQARVFNLDLPDLISAAKGILNDRFSGELLHSLMAPPEEPMECAIWQPELYLDLEHGRFFWPCESSSHYAMHLSTEYSTYDGCHSYPPGAYDGQHELFTYSANRILFTDSTPATDEELRLLNIAQQQLPPPSAFTFDAVALRSQRGSQGCGSRCVGSWSVRYKVSVRWRARMGGEGRSNNERLKSISIFMHVEGALPLRPSSRVEEGLSCRRTGSLTEGRPGNGLKCFKQFCSAQPCVHENAAGG